MKVMKHILAVLVFSVISVSSMAQCALCTKTASQLGAAPASGLNKGILYLMFIPLSMIVILAIKWYKREKTIEQNDH